MIQVKAAPFVSAPVAPVVNTPIFRTAPAVAAPAPIVKSAPVIAAPAPVVRTAPVAVAARIEEADSYPQYQYAYNVQDSLTGDSKVYFHFARKEEYVFLYDLYTCKKISDARRNS